MDAADALGRQAGGPFDVSLHQPLEPVADADDLDAFELAADGCGADDAVDAGRRPAADEDCDALVMCDGHG